MDQVENKCKKCESTKICCGSNMGDTFMGPFVGYCAECCPWKELHAIHKAWVRGEWKPHCKTCQCMWG